jgi:hypothetical protein
MEKQGPLLRIQFPEDNRPLSLKFCDFLDTTVGREKIFRLFQYLAKFILPFIKNKDQLLKLSGLIESFAALCGLTRKVKAFKFRC